MKLFGKGRWGVTQDKGGLLVGGEGAPIWLAGVIEKGRILKSALPLGTPLLVH